MGLPVVEIGETGGDKWHINAMQKVPIGKDRDNVPPAFLTAVRVRACGNDTHAREGLLWDLVDMARLPMGIDAGTAAAAVKLAGELGKTVRLEACPDGQWRAGE
jgi:hypothetical protein